jgi:hypothetical protein
MSKLLKLKEWVTIQDAALHLSKILDESVSYTDILQMALESHLKISVYFPNTAKAKLGRIVPYKDVPHIEVPTLDGKGIFRVPDGHLLEKIQGRNDLKEDTPFICFDKEVTTIRGIWDLAMIAIERIDIEHELSGAIAGVDSTMININGAFLSRPDGTWASLQGKFEAKELKDNKGNKINFSGGCYPAEGLVVCDHIKVIRTTEIANLLNKITGQSEEKQLEERERTTLLNIIGALLELLDQKDEPTIGEILEKYPTAPGLKQRTLQKKFAAARRSLGST